MTHLVAARAGVRGRAGVQTQHGVGRNAECRHGRERRDRVGLDNTWSVGVGMGCQGTSSAIGKIVTISTRR